MWAEPAPAPRGEPAPRRRVNGAAVDEALLLDAVLRQDLASFTAKTFHTVSPGTRYLDNWHVHLICEHLAACARGEITRLVINMPPRHLKSICVSVAWPAWLLGHDPSARIMAASYSRALSVKHAQDCRLVITAPWYRRLFPGVRLAPDQNEKHKFQTTARGHRIATSVGGTATGEGADVLVVDDPHNPRQALSPTMRQAALDWFDQTYSSRLDDKKRGVIVVVMQRLHERDLTGHLLAKGGWRHLCLPAEAEARTVIDFGAVRVVRAPGARLHPAREGAAEIARGKRELGSYAYAAQYQQRPAPVEGGVVKEAWFKRYAEPPADPRRIVQSWDTAHKAGELNDPSVCGTWAETETGYYLLEVVCRRMEYPALKRAARSLAGKWNPDAILIEDKASGQSLIQDLRAETKLPVIAVRPEADKLTRMSTVSPTIEAGRVFLPETAPWLNDYEAEMMSFPNSAHDDQVDMTSQFLKWAGARRPAGPRVRRL
ncbi:MAG: phage terminase large subunit [Proteobacteria bacterium]|nr:phage terminase large subunit [Pseudomonadota bacterium]